MEDQRENTLSTRISNMRAALERAVKKPTTDMNIYMIAIVAVIISGIAVWVLKSHKPEWIETHKGEYSWVKIGGIVLASILTAFFGIKIYEGM